MKLKTRYVRILKTGSNLDQDKNVFFFFLIVVELIENAECMKPKYTKEYTRETI